jgi:hypothetical protein
MRKDYKCPIFKKILKFNVLFVAEPYSFVKFMYFFMAVVLPSFGTWQLLYYFSLVLPIFFSVEK